MDLRKEIVFFPFFFLFEVRWLPLEKEMPVYDRQKQWPINIDLGTLTMHDILICKFYHVRDYRLDYDLPMRVSAEVVVH